MFSLLSQLETDYHYFVVPLQTRQNKRKEPPRQKYCQAASDVERNNTCFSSTGSLQSVYVSIIYHLRPCSFQSKLLTEHEEPKWSRHKALGTRMQILGSKQQCYRSSIGNAFRVARLLNWRSSNRPSKLWGTRPARNQLWRQQYATTMILNNVLLNTININKIHIVSIHPLGQTI